jgi:hypothetical protein
MVTENGNHWMFVVPIHPVEDFDEYADLPIYERIQMLLIDLWLIQGFLLQE